MTKKARPRPPWSRGALVTALLNTEGLEMAADVVPEAVTEVTAAEPVTEAVEEPTPGTTEVMVETQVEDGAVTVVLVM